MPAHPAATQAPTITRGAYGVCMPSVDDSGSAIDPILQKVLDAVPFRLSIEDGVDAARSRLRELPRRSFHSELRVDGRAIGASAVVVSVEYRLAPEHPYPAAVDDAWAAVQWVAEHGSEIGADTSRLAVAGDSAGGNISARSEERR